MTTTTNEGLLAISEGRFAIADAIRASLISREVPDGDGKEVSLVQAVCEQQRAMHFIAEALAQVSRPTTDSTAP